MEDFANVTELTDWLKTHGFFCPKTTIDDGYRLEWWLRGGRRTVTLIVQYDPADMTDCLVFEAIAGAGGGRNLKLHLSKAIMYTK